MSKFDAVDDDDETDDAPDGDVCINFDVNVNQGYGSKEINVEEKAVDRCVVRNIKVSRRATFFEMNELTRARQYSTSPRRLVDAIALSSL